MSAVEVERPSLEVGEAEIESTLDILRKQRIRYEPVDRAAAKEDRVIIDFLGKKDGEPFQGGQAKPITPSCSAKGMMLADFETRLKASRPVKPRPST
jgi:trigger factor